VSAIVEFVAPGEMLFQPAGKKSLFANREPRPIPLRPIRASEQRLWKLSAQAASPKFAVTESGTFSARRAGWSTQLLC